MLRPLYDQIIFQYPPGLIAIAILKAACHLIEQPFSVIEQLLADEDIICLDEPDKQRLDELMNRLLSINFNPQTQHVRDTTTYYLVSGK